ncbi:MAG: LTA synthase family protein [Planctomycetia bacterium]|nr:LTA synthase family protein [Planctomycetia bacterium]
MNVHRRPYAHVLRSLSRPCLPSAGWRFLLVFMAAPTLLRAVTLVSLWPQFPDAAELVRAGGRAMLFAIPQDAFIAIQAMWLVLAARWLLFPMGHRWRQFAAVALATALFAAAQFYVLFDFLLFNKTSLRMDYAFMQFAGDLGTMASSAWALGLGGLAVGVAAIAVCLRMLYRFFRARVPELRPSWSMALAIPAVGAIAVVARLGLDAQVRYATANVLLDDETRFVSRTLLDPVDLMGGDDRRALALLTPQAEVFRRVSPDYPLLKETLGFTGEKQFDVSIAPSERPHVVFLFMESFRGVDVGALGGRHNVSPNFDRLAREGILFTNFYGNGAQTTRAVIAGLFGVVPCFSLKSEQSAQPEMPLVGIADLFNRRGYASIFLHSGSLEFEAKDPFFRLHGYHELHGQAEIAAQFPPAPRTSWGVHDEWLMRYAVDRLASADSQRQPAQLTMFTVSNHHPWQTPPGYRPVETGVDPAHEYSRFLETFSYSDHCLGLFMDLLEERGLAKKTIVLVLADTGAPMGEHHGNFMQVNYLYEENVRIPFLILAPGRIARPVVVGDVGSQVDLLPTVMDLFSMQGLNHAVGTSLVRRVEGRTAHFNSPFAMQYLGLRRGNWKYVLNLSSGAPSLFDLSADPGESRDLAGMAGARVDLEALRADVTAVNGYLLKLHMTERFVSRELMERARMAEAPAPRDPPSP